MLRGFGARARALASAKLSVPFPPPSQTNIVNKQNTLSADDPALGCPVEYINLKGTSRENPAVCKYTGNKYYSDDWAGGH